ncbi:hypothetical protein LCGC14_2839040, partial [marine sediment metagenome]
LTVGASNAAASHSNIQAKEMIVYSVAHDTATRDQVVSYLSGVGDLGL